MIPKPLHGIDAFNQGCGLRSLLRIVGAPGRIGVVLVASLSQAAAIATEMQKGCDSRRKARGKTAGAHLGGSLGGHRIVMGLC